MYGVTVNGYVLKTQAVINSEAETALALVIDPVTGDPLQADLSDSSDIVSQVVGITLEGVGDGFLDNQAAYNQFNPSAATGDALSTVVVINGIRRKGATASTVVFTFTGTPSTTIPVSEAIEVTDSNGDVVWLVTEDIDLDITGTVTNVPAVAQTLGDITANSNTLNVLVSPNADIDTVTNPSDAIAGVNEESDTTLRSRRDKSTAAPSIGLVDSIFSAVGNLEGVTFVRVYNNIELVTDSNGIPPKTLAAVVVGGDDTEIAETLLSRTSTGNGFDGNVTITFIGIQGTQYPISFFRPTDIPIYLIISVTIVEADVFPADGIAQIQDAIVAYSQGGAPALGITDGFDTEGFPPGTDILVSRLYTPINSVPGHTITEILLGTSPTPTGTVDIPIAFNTVGLFETANIEVLVSG